MKFQTIVWRRNTLPRSTGFGAFVEQTVCQTRVTENKKRNCHTGLHGEIATHTCLLVVNTEDVQTVSNPSICFGLYEKWFFIFLRVVYFTLDDFELLLYPAQTI